MPVRVPLVAHRLREQLRPRERHGSSASLTTQGSPYTSSRVYATLSDVGDKDPRRWVLDTGASNHMTGSQAAFASIFTGMTKTV
jgi:hypothetical protein